MPIDPFSSIAGLMTIIQMTVAASEQAKSHKHNVAALARRIKMLVPLLEEVNDRQMTQAQKDNFEDLQLAIERARDLIVKCGERSKVYMMFRGTGIIERFKDVSLDLDRCLNALPLVNLKVSEEIREQVDSVSTQLRKAKYTIDEMDQKLSMDIALVLREQREGLEANQALMRQLAEKLELTSHDKVVAETRALEIEKEEVRAEKNRQEEAYISQIINLLSVMDATQEAGPSGSQEEQPPLEARPSLRMKVPPVAPEEFKCPLSLELMADPVVIASGQTFERAYIRRWWSQGHRTCPITNLPLGNLELISNFSLKRMISDWCETHDQPQPTPPVLSPPHSPTLRFLTEEDMLEKASGDAAFEDKWSKSGPVPDFRASEGDLYDEKWSKSGPMTAPDWGKDTEMADGGKGKGKYVAMPSDMERPGSHKAGFEHYREVPTAIAYDQHERLPSEFGRVSILDEAVVSGEVRPGYANPPPGPSSSAQKTFSRRTIRTSATANDSVRASGSGAERLSEEGAHGRESCWSGQQSLSSEFKPPKPAAAAGKGDPSVPGHRRNSSAPLSELSSAEATRVMNLQAFPVNPPSDSHSSTPSLHPNRTTTDPTPFQAHSELWSEALADASPDCLHHSLSDVRSSPHESHALPSDDAAKTCPPLGRSGPHRNSTQPRDDALESCTPLTDHATASKSKSPQRRLTAIERLQRALSGTSSRQPHGPPQKRPSPAPPLGEESSKQPTHASSVPPVQASAKEHGSHRAPPSGPPQDRSAHTPPRNHSAHATPIPSQVAAAHAQPYRGDETEDLSGFNFAPPPPLSSSLPRPSSTTNSDRNQRYSDPLPAKRREEGGHYAASAHDAHDHAAPGFAPPSPIHNEIPVAVTHSGHAVRQDSYNPHQRTPSADSREPLADPKRPVTASELQSMGRELRSGKPDLIRAAAGDLRLLAKFSMENRKAIAGAGIVPDLIGLLLSKDLKTQENAVTALLNLSIHDGNKAIIARDGAISRLVEVLQGGSQAAKENAAATLFSLSVLEECKQQIGAQAGAILGLVDLLRTGSALGKKDATTALFNLSICHENKSRIVRNGAVGPLIQLIKDPSLQEKVVAVLANLTTVGEGRLAITEANGIKALVQVTERGTPRSRENAAAALLQLCINSSRHTAEVYQEGLVPSLMSLQQTGTPRAKEKARSLLRHFRDNLHDTVKP